MATLAQLLAVHHRILVLDAASTRTQVGLLQGTAAPIWSAIEAEAGTALFTAIETVLLKAGQELGEIDAFAFCEGPGSMLGTRTIAMALRAWQVLKPRPAYAYQSLAIAGRGAWVLQPRSFTVIADARRDTWHCQPIEADGSLRALQRRPAAGLPAGELVMPENFRTWATPPRPPAICRYELAEIFPGLADADFFHQVDSADAFQHEAPEYKQWSAQLHSAANAPDR